MKNPKIIATIGPASDSVATIAELFGAGMDVARINLSHGNVDYFKKIIRNIRQVSSKIAIMLDTKGPEVRTANSSDVTLSKGQTIELVNKQIAGKLPINYDHLGAVPVGEMILLDDGLIELKVISKTKDGLLCSVLNSGIIGKRKKVSIRGHLLKLPFLSAQDKADILFAIKQNVDFIAASFVRNKEDINQIRQILGKHKSKIRIIAKIENQYAVKNLKDIISHSDGIMVARGDLGVELPLYKVPEIQAHAIKLCNEAGQVVIVATQMLESMITNPRPTRAEVNDVALAILQGADAVMLSGETTIGKFPVQAVEMMATIAKEYGSKLEGNPLTSVPSDSDKWNVGVYLASVVGIASRTLDIKLIIAPTNSGFTARNISRFRPKVPILAYTSDEQVARQLQLYWGVIPIVQNTKYKHRSDMQFELIQRTYKEKFVGLNDKVAFVAGHKSIGVDYTNHLEIIPVKNMLKKQ